MNINRRKICVQSILLQSFFSIALQRFMQLVTTLIHVMYYILGYLSRDPGILVFFYHFKFPKFSLLLRKSRDL